MTQDLRRNLILLFIGAVLGASLVASLNATQEYRPAAGYVFWNKADGNIKFASLIGYSDAEQIYRLALDKGAKPFVAKLENPGSKILTERFQCPPTRPSSKRATG